MISFAVEHWNLMADFECNKRVSKMISEELKEKPIYIFYDNNTIFYKDIVNALKKSEIEKGDTIFVHVNLGAFGKLGTIIDRSDFANLYIEAFLEVIGQDGTIVTPTYTYSFCDGEIYDPDTTPSKVGLFSDEFRKRLDSYRSVNPIFSVSAIGKKAKNLTTNLSKSCFGNGSIFDKLQEMDNSKYVVVGVGYFICSQVHYIEQCMNVPYRYVKNFYGIIKIKDKTYEDVCEFYVRHLDWDVNTNFDKIEQHLIDKELMKKIPLGQDFISTVKIRNICDEGAAMLKKDPNYFLTKPPVLK